MSSSSTSRPTVLRKAKRVRALYRAICVGSVVLAGYGFIIGRSAFPWFLATALMSATCAGDISIASAIKAIIAGYSRSGRGGAEKATR